MVVDIRRGTPEVETEQETEQGTTRASFPPLIGCLVKRYHHQIGRVIRHTDAGEYLVIWTDFDAIPPQWGELVTSWQLREMIIDPMSLQHVDQW